MLYCSNCRNTPGDGGSAINIMGQARMSKHSKNNALTINRARLLGAVSPACRHSTNKKNFFHRADSFI
jgi:hypothetical protein